MNPIIAILAAGALVLSLQSRSSAPPQEPPVQSASLTGKVVDSATGAPIARAVVVLRARASFSGPQAVTDAEGRFAFTGVTPGPFSVSATAGEFIGSHAPYRTSGETRPLRPGEVRDLRIPLQRAVVISGRIVNDTGVPMSGVSVRVRDLSTGFHGDADFRRRTDDRGAFRLFGLPPGRYIVCATVHGAAAFGRSGKPRLRFVDTCYPSATDEATALAVPVGPGQEIDGLEIRMQRRATFTITGTIVDASGRPAESVQLWLTTLNGDGASGSGQRVERGRFTISDVVPGRYVLRAEVGPPPAPAAPPPTEAGVVELGFVSENVEGLVITTKKSVSVRGVVTFEDGAPPEAKNLKLRVEPQRMGLQWFSGRGSATEVRPDLTFELKDLIGPYVLQLFGLPTGSAVSSIRYRGRDIAHLPAEFDGDPQQLIEIVVTERVSEVSGRVLDASGNPVAAARLYMFPADSARWPGWSRGAARSNLSGAYRIRSLLSGDYFVVAISEEDLKEITAADWYRPNPYERFATIAERITVLQNDRRVIDLRVTPIPLEWKR